MGGEMRSIEKGGKDVSEKEKSELYKTHIGCLFIL